MGDQDNAVDAMGEGDHPVLPALGHEAMIMHAGWWENTERHHAWLEHLAREATVENLLADEVLLLGARVGGQQRAAAPWLAQLRRMAARVGAGDPREMGDLLDRLELLARVAVAVRVADASAW